MTGKEFQDKRLSLGYSQLELSKVMGFSKRTIESFELRDKVPNYAESAIKRIPKNKKKS